MILHIRKILRQLQESLFHDILLLFFLEEISKQEEDINPIVVNHYCNKTLSTSSTYTLEILFLLIYLGLMKSLKIKEQLL